MFSAKFLRWLYIKIVPRQIKRLYKRMEMKLRPRPMMSNQEIQILNNILSSPFVHKVLEIGSGGSTLYYPTRHPVEWHSVEFNASWYQDIQKFVSNNVQLYLLEDISAFIAKFSPRAKEFQLVLIDGPDDNREQVIESVRGWDTDAIVLLHDSGRRVYEEALSGYFRCVNLTAGEFARPNGGCKARGLSLLMSAPPGP
jgi:phage pi2 protein 07